MPSPTLEALRNTLGSIRRRRARLTLLHQLSVACICLASLFLGLSLIEMWISPTKVVNTILFFFLLVASVGVISRFINNLSRSQSDDRNLAHYVDERIPDLEQRLLTSLEFDNEDLDHNRRGVSKQFIQQLWVDAVEHIERERQQVESVITSRKPWMFFASASAMLIITTSALFMSEALFEASGQLLWPFRADPAPLVVTPAPEIIITVEPGDVELQRGDSLNFVARVTNVIPASVQLRVQDDNVNWQDMTMFKDASGNNSATYSYFMSAIEEDLVYYVNFEFNGVQRSQQFRVSLYDLPQVEQIDLVFDYPRYTQIEDDEETDSGDMVVPEGTEVAIAVIFNKNIAEATIQFDYEEETGYEIPLVIEANVGRANITVSKDSVYRIVAVDFDDLVNRNPDDYYIRAIEDLPPELILRRPGRDQRVMPLEEVLLEVDATDDYGLSEFSLNYSVIGTATQTEVRVDFLPEVNTRAVTGNELVYLEDLGVTPGDFISYYLTLADNNEIRGSAEIISDIYFLEVIPTDREFRKGGGGMSGQGGGGQGGESSALVKIQKDIIAATWKLRNRLNKVSFEAVSQDSRVISESEQDAIDRARMSIDRLSERLSFSDESYDNAVKNLQLAIEQMNLAVAELDKEQITSALRPEQLALQFIMKAEADINRTTVSMQSGGGGGGGGAQQEREDLRELFEMEMGQLENRYETPDGRRKNASEQETRQANKLEELARRQEGLTRAQRNLARRMEQLNEEQRRRELEKLQRQQEQLSEEVQQLAQQMSRSQRNRRGQQSQGRAGANGQTAGGEQQNHLQRAAQQMQEAAQSDSPSMAAARSQKALENLRQQQKVLQEQENRSVNQLAQNIGQQAQQLLKQQQDLQRGLNSMQRNQGLGRSRAAARNDEGLQKLVTQQQRQRRDLDEIEKMLKAIIARGDNDDQRLMSQAQKAIRTIRPIQQQMDTSRRVLNSGMVTVATDIESEIEGDLSELSQELLAMNPTPSTGSDQLQQAAQDAAELLRQIANLEQQALAFNQRGEDGELSEQGIPSLRQMREQLQRSQQLARQLTSDLQQQQRQDGSARGRRGRGEDGPRGNQPGRGQSAGNQQASSEQGDGQRGGGQRDGSPGGGRGQLGGGRIDYTGGSTAYGNARSIRQLLTQQSIEEFLNQPELFKQLLQPILELEGQLRSQAELEKINKKLYASAEEDVPDQYKRLVEQYYRVLSENTESADTAQ